jgi:hypothetical protein
LREVICASSPQPSQRSGGAVEQLLQSGSPFAVRMFTGARRPQPAQTAWLAGSRARHDEQIGSPFGSRPAIRRC